MPIYYKVVKGSLSNLAKFEQEVAGFLTNGYIPVGGMTTPDSEGTVYQAIAYNTNGPPGGPGGPGGAMGPGGARGPGGPGAPRAPGAPMPPAGAPVPPAPPAPPAGAPTGK